MYPSSEQHNRRLSRRTSTMQPLGSRLLYLLVCPCRYTTPQNHHKNHRHACFRLLMFSRCRDFHRKRSGLAFSMGKMFKYYPVHEIALPLGLQKSLALPVFHPINMLWHCVVFREQKQGKCVGYLEYVPWSYQRIFGDCYSARWAVWRVYENHRDICAIALCPWKPAQVRLSKHDDNCSLHVPVVWIEFLQPPQLWSSTSFE